MNEKMIRLRVRPLSGNITGGVFGALALDHPKAIEHRMIFSDYANGALRTEGGNPDRYFAPIDPLWWLCFMCADAPEFCELEGQLREAKAKRR